MSAKNVAMDQQVQMVERHRHFHTLRDSVRTRSYLQTIGMETGRIMEEGVSNGLFAR